MANCTKCGRELTGEDVFCPECGERNPSAAGADSRSGLNVLAIVGMGLSVIGLPLAGLIVSIIALKRAVPDRFRNPLAGLSKAGIIVGAAATVYSILMIALSVLYFFFMIRMGKGPEFSDSIFSAMRLF